MPTTEFLGFAEIAAELGLARQTIRDRFEHGYAGGLPKPDAELGGAPLWKRSTLERAGILPTKRGKR